MDDKSKVVLYGLGGRFFENKDYIEKVYQIVAIADCDYQKQGKYENYNVISPSNIMNYSFEKIIITSREFKSILPVLKAMGIPNEKVELLVGKNDSGHMWTNVKMSPSYENGEVYCCFDNIHFSLKNRSDFMVMNDIFMKNGWNFYCKERVVVIDIGMNIGLSCLYFANMENVECVYGYEPFLQTYENAIDNFSRNPLKIQDKIQPMNCALTDSESCIEVSYNPFYTTNMRVDQGKRTHGEAEEKVWVKTLSAATVLYEITEKHKDKKIVMKLDCEGSEYPIIKNLAENSFLENIYMILMETHDGRENEVKKYLRDKGFIFFDNYVGGGPELGFLYAVNLKN